MFHPPPPPPKVDQVKFVKPVVAKAEEEEPPKSLRIKKKIGAETIKEIRCSFVRCSSRSGPTKIVEDNQNLQHSRYRSKT
jgi:protein TonB